jgi:hypothetical protein
MQSSMEAIREDPAGGKNLDDNASRVGCWVQ